MLTLIEYSKLVQSPLASGVIETFANVNPVLERMPFQDIAGNAYKYNVEEALPGVAFRGLNEAYAESTGVLNPVTESLTICGGDSDFDVALVKMGVGSANVRAAHDALKAKSLSLSWLSTFFSGDTSADPRQFDGLKRRLTGSQVVNAGGAGGAALTLDKLDELLDAVRGDNKVLLMNRTMRRAVNKLIRAAGQAIETVQDGFGRQLLSYGGTPIAEIDEDAAGNAILPFTEDDGSGNADTTSIFAASFGLGSMFGIQTEPMSVRDLGELDSKPAYRTRTEWYSGIVIANPRAAARLRWINQPA